MINPMIGRLFPITRLQKDSYVAEKSPAHQNVSLRTPFLKDCPTPFIVAQVSSPRVAAFPPAYGNGTAPIKLKVEAK